MKKHIRVFLSLALSIACLVTQIPASAASTGMISFFKSSTEQEIATNANAKEIYYFLVYNMGLNSAAACGVLANIRRESCFNPDCLGDNDTSYGICQWHDTDIGVGRFSNLINWCTENGYDYTRLDGQLHFLQYELSQNNYLILYNGKTIYDALLAVENTADGAYEAGYYWCNTFEVPFSNNPDRREAECDARGTFARDIYWPAYSEPTLDDAFIVAGGLQINWNVFDGADQYELYRYKNADPSTMELITVTTDTYALDSSVKSGNEYTYLLCAITLNADGTTTTSNAKEVTQFYLAEPLITKISGTPDSQTLKWKKVKGATRYDIYRSRDGGDYTLIDTTTKTSYKDLTEMVSSVRYSYQVYACHASEEAEPIYSLASNAVGTYSLDQPVITGVTNVKDGAKVKWEKVPKAKYYTIYRSENNSEFEEIASVTTASFVDTDVTNKANVSYQIQAYYNGKDGQTSKSNLSEVASGLYIKAPTLKSVTSTKSKSITPKWTRNKKVTGYEIQYCKKKAFKTGITTLRIVTNDTTSWRIKSLEKGKTYYVRVRCYLNKGGTKYYSGWSSKVKCIAK